MCPLVPPNLSGESLVSVHWNTKDDGTDGEGRTEWTRKEGRGKDGSRGDNEEEGICRSGQGHDNVSGQTPRVQRRGTVREGTRSRPETDPDTSQDPTSRYLSPHPVRFNCQCDFRGRSGEMEEEKTPKERTPSLFLCPWVWFDSFCASLYSTPVSVSRQTTQT